jgi:hypothetical protein
LKLISALPEGSDLYNFKMKHYKMHSEVRNQAELVLQEQRMKRVQKNYQLQNFEIERRIN